MQQATQAAPVADALSEPDLLDPAELFHEASKLRRHREELLRTARHDRGLARLVDQSLTSALGRGAFGRVTPSRRLCNVVRTHLPVGARTGSVAALGRLARERRSTRSFAPDPIALADLAEILRLTYGFGGGFVSTERPLLRRAIPSPGALFSLELYVAALRVDALECGIYHYDVTTHSLCQVRTIQAANAFEDVLTSLGGVTGCAAYVIVSSVLERLRWKYGPRAYRLALLEVGHAGQQICLASTALGLGACPVQAFLDDDLTDLIGVDGVSELPLHLVGVGRRSDLAGPEWPRDQHKPSLLALASSERGLVVRPPWTGEAAARPTWEEVDAEMIAAFRELASGRAREARGRLVALEARLCTPDATVRDYLRLSERHVGSVLLAGEGVLLHLETPESDPYRATDLLRSLETAYAEMKQRLGVERAPAAFVEVSQGVARAITLVGHRLVQRKVCLPPWFSEETLWHEMVHAICAPPNIIAAEGIACLASASRGAIREAEHHLGTDSRERLLALFRRRAPGATGGEALRDEDAWLVYPIAGSFLLFLEERSGRATLDRFTSALVVAGSDATSEEQEALFEEAFEIDLDSAATEWWHSVGGSRR